MTATSIGCINCCLRYGPARACKSRWQARAAQPSTHTHGLPTAVVAARRLQPGEDSPPTTVEAACRRLAGGSDTIARRRGGARRRSRCDVTAAGCATSCIAHPSCILPSCIVRCLGKYIISVHSDGEEDLVLNFIIIAALDPSLINRVSFVALYS
jgi:hypothetical protein